MLFLLLAVQVILCTYSASAQYYPYWLNSPNQKNNEYPTAIASVPDFVATVGFYEENFVMADLNYSTFHTIPCIYCNNKENIFVNWKYTGANSTWTALISANNGSFNNQVNVQSAPQVDVSDIGEVYVSFTYKGNPVITDARGNNVTINSTGNLYNLAVVKFDTDGNYRWHFTEGGSSHTFITDLDYNDKTKNLAIAGYLVGSNSVTFDGSVVLNPLVRTSMLTGFPYGNAFAAVYKQNWNSANIAWGKNVDIASYSTDVVQDNDGNVFLSGMFEATDINSNWISIANNTVTNNYVEPNASRYNDYFLVKFDAISNPVWSEIYGATYNELQITPDKHLRYSSLAIDPQTSNLVFALSSTGGSGGTMFNEYGTYVNQIKSSDGSISAHLTVGTTKTFNASINTCPKTKYGSPTYNPSIAVDKNGAVFVTGNFLLTTNSSTSYMAPSYEIEIGSTLLNQGMTTAGSLGHSTSVGLYTAIIDFGSLTIYNENLNSSYVTAYPIRPYNQLPVYGITQDIDHSNYFYHILGFNYGTLKLDLNVNGGTVNTYDNSTNGYSQYDGFILRTDAQNGLLTKRQNVATTQTTTKEEKNLKELPSTDATWVLSPNPVASGQSLLWKSETEEVVDYIRLMDMTGKVIQVWNSPQATAQGFQLSMEQLVAGTYVLEASGAAVQQSTMVIVK